MLFILRLDPGTLGPDSEGFKPEATVLELSYLNFVSMRGDPTPAPELMGSIYYRCCLSGTGRWLTPRRLGSIWRAGERVNLPIFCIVLSDFSTE